MCNVDEHIYHPDLRGLLERCQKDGVTLVSTKGYQMIADKFPETEGCLYETVRRGLRWGQMDKTLIFDPNAIEEINYGPGRHRAMPQGCICEYPGTDVKLLHYKCLGLEYLIRRSGELGERLGALDKKSGWGHRYCYDEAAITEEFEKWCAKSVQVLSVSD